MSGGLSSVSKLPVLIVGGGIGGFTAALSLHRAGIRSNIIIRQSKFTQHARSGVFLGGSAVRILDRLGLGSQFRTLGTPIHGIEINNVRGKEILSVQLGNIGTEVWTVPRADLQQAFYESIPAESVHFDTKFRALRLDENDVKVEVQQISDAQHPTRTASSFSCSTKFVIGADGLNSAVRMFMSRPAMTVSSGVFIWRAVVRNQDLERFPFHIGREVWDVNRRFGYARMSPNEVVWWAVVSNFNEVVLRPFTPRLLRLFEKFPAEAIELISSTGSDRDVYRAEMKRVWPERFPWVDPNSSRIALVGDAGRPGNFENFHTSCTFAIEDSYSLAHHLAEQKEKGRLSMHPRLEAYEESREEQVSATRRYSNRFNQLYASQSSLRRFLVNKFVKYSVERLAVRGAASTISNTMSEP